MAAMILSRNVKPLSLTQFASRTPYAKRYNFSQGRTRYQRCVQSKDIFYSSICQANCCSSNVSLFHTKVQKLPIFTHDDESKKFQEHCDKISTSLHYSTNFPSYLRGSVLINSYGILSKTTTSKYNTTFKRNFHSSKEYKGEDSKIKQAINAVKNMKRREAQKRIESIAIIDQVDKTKVPDKETEIAVKKEVMPAPVVKKSIGQRFIHEVKHYYHGFKLLFTDVRVAMRYIWKMLKGGSLTRREHRQLVTTVSDMFRLVPFMVFIIVPFMEFLLPIALKLFPNMLPSTFTEEDKEKEKVRKRLKVKLEMAKFLQSTLEETALTRKGAKGETVHNFATFLERIRSTGEHVENEEILKYSQLFEDEITLDNLNYRQLRAICKLLEIPVVDLSATVLRFQIRYKLRELETDDRMIQKEGIDSLSEAELQQACRVRGMRALGLTREALKGQLNQWLDLHLKYKIPSSLLLLTRTLYLSEPGTTVEHLKSSLSNITTSSPSAAEEAKVRISEVSGDRIDNKAKLEIIRQEEEIIREETKALEKERVKKDEKKLKDDMLPSSSSEKTLDLNAPTKDDKSAEVIVDKISENLEPTKAEILVDKAEPLVDTAANVKDEKDEKEILPEDLSDIEDCLEHVADKKTKLSVEKEDLQELKQQQSEYIESMEELKSSVMADDGKPELEESKAARNLRKSVNSMIKQMDTVVSDLAKKKEILVENIEQKQSTVENESEQDAHLRKQVFEQIKQYQDDLVDVNDILKALKRIRKTSDDKKLQKISQVAQALDTDEDGRINLSHALKVIELIGKENVKITPDEVARIVSLLEKETDMHEYLKEKRLKEKEEEVETKQNIPAKSEKV